MKTRRIAFCLRTVSLAAAVLAAGCGKKDSTAAEKPARTLAVRALPVATRDFERRLTVQGTLETRTFAAVAARTDGNLDAIWVDEGDPVVAGQTPLFQIDPASRQKRLASIDAPPPSSPCTVSVWVDSGRKVCEKDVTGLSRL